MSLDNQEAISAFRQRMLTLGRITEGEVNNPEWTDRDEFLWVDYARSLGFVTTLLQPDFGAMPEAVKTDLIGNAAPVPPPSLEERQAEQKAQDEHAMDQKTSQIDTVFPGATEEGKQLTAEELKAISETAPVIDEEGGEE